MATPFKVTDADIKTNLSLYRSAWSKTYQSFVEILSFRFDDLGEPVIRASVPGQPSQFSDGATLFRVCELNKFSLQHLNSYGLPN